MFFDFLGSLASFLSTLFFIRLSTKAWPIGLLATVINGGLYWYKGIYADVGLELIYMISMLYGWYLWHHKPSNQNPKHPDVLNSLTVSQWILVTVVFLGTYTLVYYVLVHYTNSNVALLDALTTTLSLVAQWLMCHKIILTWVLWFVTDALYAWMYWIKGLPVHTFLMIIYTGMAVTGFMYWLREHKSRASTNQLFDLISSR